MKLRNKPVIRLLYSVSFLLLLGGSLSVGLQLRQANLDSALISAIKTRENVKAIALLEQGANANAVDSSGRSTTIKTVIADFWNRLWGRNRAQISRSGIPAIMLACEDPEKSVWPPGYKAPIKRNVPRMADQMLLIALLKHGGDPNSCDKGNGYTALYSQVVADNLAAVKLLLEAGSNPNGMAINAQTPFPPLINAVAGNEYDIASLLLQHGIAVDAAGPEGMTALHWAMSTGSVRMLKLLLSYHPNVNAPDDDGWTPLMYEDWSLEKIRLLVQHGARISLKNGNGDTVLDRVTAELPESPKRTEILRILTDAARREAAEPGR